VRTTGPGWRFLVLRTALFGEFFPPFKDGEFMPATRSRIAAVLLSVVAVLAPGQASAAAPDYDGIYPTDRYKPHCADLGGDPTSAATVCLTDNSALYYYADSSGWGKLEDADKLHLWTMLYDEFEPTNLSVAYDYTPIFSGGSETDVVYQESSKNLDGGAVGIMWCNDRVNGNDWRCDQAYVRIEGHGWYQNHGVTCHETGHAVGLVHGAEAAPKLSQQDSRLGCMVTNMQPPSSLGTNNRQFINAVY
jgi:hypothetical protein